MISILIMQKYKKNMIQQEYSNFFCTFAIMKELVILGTHSSHPGAFPEEKTIKN